MNDSITEIKNELMVTREELLSRMQEDTSDDRFTSDNVASVYENEKNLLVNKHIKEELKDVNRALFKMECGLFGICEHTGKPIPFEQLKIIPTVRTINESERTNMFFIH